MTMARYAFASGLESVGITKSDLRLCFRVLSRETRTGGIQCIVLCSEQPFGSPGVGAYVWAKGGKR